jgi:hypothetical protein
MMDGTFKVSFFFVFFLVNVINSMHLSNSLTVLSNVHNTFKRSTRFQSITHHANGNIIRKI